MSALMAIVLDTWRQSRQQVVFMILLAVLAIIVGCAVFLPTEELPVLTRWKGKGLGNVGGPAVAIDQDISPTCVASGDLDGDGDVDLLVGSGSAPSQVLLNDGQGGFSAAEPLPAAADSLWLVNLDGDKDVDAVLVSAGGGAQVWRNDGRARFVAQGSPLGNSVKDLELSDLDGDGDVDLVTAEGEGPAQVWLNGGEGTFSAGPTLGPGRRVDSGDVDGDGDLDLALLGPEEIGLWLREGEGYQAAPKPLRGKRLEALVVADFDGNGKAEVLAVGRRPRLWVRRGPGQWEAGTASFNSMRGVSRAIAIEASGDDKLDVILVGANQSALFMNTTREGYTEPIFTVVRDLPEGTTGALTFGHFDGDALIDAVGVAGERGLDLPVLTREWQELLWASTYAQRFVVFPESDEGPGQGRDDRATTSTLKRYIGTTTYRRDLELLAVVVGKMIFTLSMVLFIAACAGYFPGLLASGGVDIVLARPLSRLQIFMGKYLGGLLLYGMAILAAYLLLVVGFYLRFGIFLPSVLLFVPIQILAAAVLYAVLACLGIMVRSSALPLLVGLFLFLAVDTALEFGIKLQRAGALGEWAEGVGEWSQILLPNFGLLKDVATFSVFGAALMPWQPVVTALTWLLLFLGLGYWRFRRSDY